MNFKKYGNSILLAALVLAVPAARAADDKEIKIGVANLQKALQESKKGKAAKATLEKESTAKRKELEKKEADLKKMQEELMKKSSVLSEKAAAEKQGQFQQKAAEFQQNVQMATVDLQKRESELTRPIIDDLRKLVPEISRKHSLDIVFEASSGSVLYAKSQTDVTEELISLYDGQSK